MPATVPASDLSDAPDDWLQAYFTLIDEDGKSEDKFVRQLEVIHLLRDIAERDGDDRHAPFDEVKAELIRRGLREPDPEPEFISRSATVAAIKEHDGCSLQRARWLAGLLPCVAEDGRQWIYGRQWYRRADVEEFLADE